MLGSNAGKQSIDRLLEQAAHFIAFCEKFSPDYTRITIATLF